VTSNIKLDPVLQDSDILEGVKAKSCESLNHKSVYTLHEGGFTNTALCFNGTAIATMDHILDFGFQDVLQEGTNMIPADHCVIQIDCGANDFSYIVPENPNSNIGEVYTVARDFSEDSKLKAPQKVDLPANAKLVASSVSHHFAVTVDHTVEPPVEKIFAWLPHEDYQIFEVKGLLNEKNGRILQT